MIRWCRAFTALTAVVPEQTTAVCRRIWSKTMLHCQPREQTGTFLTQVGYDVEWAWQRLYHGPCYQKQLRGPTMQEELDCHHWWDRWYPRKPSELLFQWSDRVCMTNKTLAEDCCWRGSQLGINEPHIPATLTKMVDRSEIGWSTFIEGSLLQQRWDRHAFMALERWQGYIDDVGDGWSKDWRSVLATSLVGEANIVLMVTSGCWLQPRRRLHWKTQRPAAGLSTKDASPVDDVAARKSESFCRSNCDNLCRESWCHWRSLFNQLRVDGLPYMTRVVTNSQRLLFPTTSCLSMRLFFVLLECRSGCIMLHSTFEPLLELVHELLTARDSTSNQGRWLYSRLHRDCIKLNHQVYRKMLQNWKISMKPFQTMELAMWGWLTIPQVYGQTNRHPLRWGNAVRFLVLSWLWQHYSYKLVSQFNNELWYIQRL